MEWNLFFLTYFYAMLTCVSFIWQQLLVFCYYIFIAHDFVAASVNKNGLESSTKFVKPTSEPGFNLNEEDIAKFHIWPTGNIPYFIDDFSFDKALRDRIRMFLGGVNGLTSLRFAEIPRPPEDDKTRWVLFLNRKGLLDCADHSFDQFTNEGVQKVVLGYHCLNSDENLADIVLTLVGVPPQHNSPDRDKYVVINKNNILPDKLHLFKKLKDDEWLFHNLTYDFESAGHYGTYKYTANGKVTVEKKHRDYNLLGPPLSRLKENGFSSNDILKIAILYNYIVRNRESTVPECEKLFAPGSKLSSSIVDNTKLNMQHREKPERYLGKSEKGDAYEEKANDEKNTDNNNESEKNVNLQKSDSEDNDNEDIDKNANDENLDDDGKNGTHIDNEDYNDENARYDEDNVDEVNQSVENNSTETNNTNDQLIGDENIEKDTYNDNDDKGAEYDRDEGDEVLGGVENNKTETNTTNSEQIADDVKMNTYDVEDDIKKDSLNEGNHNNGLKESDQNFIDDSNNTTITSKLPLAYKTKINLKKKKLLGQSDYETGDEGNKKYIHQKYFHY